MKSSMIRVRIDKEIKDKAEKVLEELGMNISVAVRMYLHHVVKEHEDKKFDLDGRC